VHDVETNHAIYEKIRKDLSISPRSLSLFIFLPLII
jgi:hypothetical protein